MELFGAVDMFFGGAIIFMLGVLALWGTFSWFFDRWIFSRLPRETVWKMIMETRKKGDLK